MGETVSLFFRNVPGTALCPYWLVKMNTNPTYFPNTGRQFLVTEDNFPAQTGHNGFYHSGVRGPGFMLIQNGADQARLWVSDDSQKGLDLSEKMKLRTVNATRIKTITIPSNSDFIPDCYL